MNTTRTLFLAALCVSAAVVAPMFGVLAAVLFLIVLSTVINKPSGNLCTTLSVPELLMDVLDAFKTEIPFLMDGFSTDFSSKTAVKGDTITAHISTLPVASTYDAATGFANGATAAEALISDVPVVMDQFIHVPVKVTWLTQLASKIPLYKEAIRNYGYVLAKSVVDAAMAKITAANFTYSKNVQNANVVLESLEDWRTQLTTVQKAQNRGRFGIVSSGLAAAIQNDDRVKSSLFYGILNGDQGYRTFKNLAGFSNIWEYPDMATAGGLTGLFADKRAIVVANRRVDFSNAAQELGITQVMNFYPISDPSTGLEMTGVGWQQPGTGDVYVSAAILYGIGAGAQGGAQNAITDRAGLRITGN